MPPTRLKTQTYGTRQVEDKQLTATLNLTSQDGNLSFTKTAGYKQLYDIQQEVDNANGFVTLVTLDPSSIGQNQLKDPKFICIYNESDQVAEICITYQGITASTTDATGGADGVISKILRPNEYVVYPNAMAVNYITADNSAMNGTDLSLDDVVPNSNEYTDSDANVDSATADGVVSSNTSTTLYLEPYTSATNCTANLFKVGDLIQVGTEVMEVTAIGDKSNLANNYLTVKRGVAGSVALSDISDADAVNFPFFNGMTAYTSATGGYDVVQTDESGNFKSTNFFGYGRNANTANLDGFCRGTIGFRFYEAGYQEMGLSGITNATSTGLTAGTTYYIKIGIDGATADELSITMDSSVTTFGGTNGFLQKFQTAIDDLYADHGKNNKGKKATVSLINGDVRVTSNSHLSTSAIALTAGTSGADTTTELLAQQIGLIPILAKIEHAIGAKLPDTTIVKDGISVPNTDAYLLDDGYGKLVSGASITGSGTIDYDTGAVTLRNCPPLAEFTISGIGLSGLACGGNTALNMNQY